MFKKHQTSLQIFYKLLADSPLASRGFALRGLTNLIFRILNLKEKNFKKIILWVGIFLGVLGCPTPQEIVINLPWTNENYHVKENPISLVVSETLRYRHIDRKTSFYFVLQKIFYYKRATFSHVGNLQNISDLL